MPTNDERREVAERLRTECKRTDDHPTASFDWAIYNALDPNWYKYGYVSYNATVDRLADLIEPEERTCRMRDATWDDGQCTWGCVCSECGARHAHKSGRWMNFCPSCGAKVVSE